MGRREPALALAFTIYSCYVAPARAMPGENSAREREQSILRVQGLIEEHNLAEAQRLLEEASKEFPGDAGFENLRGVVKAQQGDYSAAEASFRAAIARPPAFTGAYLNLGPLYQEHSA